MGLSMTSQAASLPSLDDRRSTVDDRLDDERARLPRGIPASVWESVLLAPARDLLARPSKAIRAALVEAGWRLAGGHGRAPQELAQAIEILHAGSLIVDDIEDGALERRGHPAIHVRYGVPAAINSGNWMYFWAFALLDQAPVDDATRVRLYRAMLRATRECHAGQALDLGIDVTRTSRERLRVFVEHATSLKSGSLVALALSLGAIAAQAPAGTLATIEAFGVQLGIALQMLDDVGGITSADRAAKAREDLANNRLTWAWVFASEHADDATWKALSTMPLPELAPKLAALAAHGRDEIRARLARALDGIRPIARPDTLAMLERELAKLEVSYG